MALGDVGKTRFTCPKCSAVYECRFRDYPAPDPTQTYECKTEGCKAVVHTWKGTRDYSEWNVIRHGSLAKLPDDELLERHWGRAIVHESGHALIAVLKKIPCHGIFWDKTANKFCVLADVPDDFNEYSNEHYIFSVGGGAAEIVVYNDCDEGAARADRLPFESAGAPSVTMISNEAFDTLSANERELKKLVSLVKAECKGVDLNLAALNETVTNRTGHAFGTLLSKEQLEQALDSD
jgi:hypothetical protein